jgi:CelD/BcsL family acetyltransferase involved in cellulose biosynthesis
MTETALAAVPAHPLRPAAPEGKRALDAVSVEDWMALLQSSLEANAFLDPAFALPANRHARGTRASDILQAHDHGRVIGLLPVTTAWQAYRLPIPALVGAQPYTVLGTPLLLAEQAELAAEGLLDAAAEQGAHLLDLHMIDLDGPAMAALSAAAMRRKLQVTIHREHERAVLAVPDDAEAYLRGGMGAKKLKELRRQRHRLNEEGAIAFRLYQTVDDVMPALERFLALEARGWKGARGTGLAQHEGDRRFITEAARSLAEREALRIFEMTLDGSAIATGLVLCQCDTALFFKVAYDEALSRFSPGVQLTVELTRRFSEEGQVRLVDSAALPGHPMIDHVWRERRRIGNVLIETRPGALASLSTQLILGRDRLREAAKTILHATQSALNKREKSR